MNKPDGVLLPAAQSRDQCSRRRSPVMRVADIQEQQPWERSWGLRPRLSETPQGGCSSDKMAMRAHEKAANPIPVGFPELALSSKAYCRVPPPSNCLQFHGHVYHDALYNTPSKQKQKEIKGSSGAIVTQHRVAFTEAGCQRDFSWVTKLRLAGEQHGNG